MHRASFLIGMVGLNELVQIHTGREMHQAKQAFKFGLKVIAHMRLMIDRFSQRYGMRFVLEQTPAESTAYRFAKLDLNTTRRNRDTSSRRYLERRSLLHELDLLEQRCRLEPY
jgi:anaerobic ribonucleoside-triphosphate reductase